MQSRTGTAPGAVIPAKTGIQELSILLDPGFVLRCAANFAVASPAFALTITHS